MKSIIFLSIMFVPYMLLLRKESFFRFNRLMLLSIMAFSLVLPLCNFSALSWETNPVNEHLQGVVEVGLPTIVDDAWRQETALQADESSLGGISHWRIVHIIYIIGVLLTVCIKTFQLSQLYLNIHRGVLWTDKCDGITIYCHANNVAPFSWFRTIVISEDDYNRNATEILRHETGHITNLHSLDIIFVNIVETVQWCNPLVWILANSLRDVHEYEADDAVLRSGINAHQYQSLLIRKAVGSSSYAFANSFNHSLLKKRITMMLRKKSNPWMKSKALYILPVAVIALSAFATPEIVKPLENTIAENAPTADYATAKLVEEAVKQSTPVSEAKLLRIKIDKQGKILLDTDYPTLDDLSKEIASGGYDANTIVDFEVSEYAPEETVAAVKSILRRNNILKLNIKTHKEQEGDASDDMIWDVVEDMPQFESGERSLMQYISQNIRYPKIAYECNVTGRVIVKFIVEKDGSVSNVEIEKNGAETTTEVKEDPNVMPDVTVIGYTKKEGEQYLNTAEFNTAKQALADESIRVIKETSGKWTAGKQQGKNVRVKYLIPLTFRLQ